jgi:hypothetical protein
VFSNFWSIYGSRKVLLGKKVLILSGKNLTVLTSNKKTTFLISEVCFTYKFIIPDIKRKQNIFFGFFLNIGLVLKALINLLLKPKCMLKHILNFFIFFCIRKNEIIFFYLGETWLYARKQNIFLFYKFFCNVMTKTGYFNIAFVSLRYKNLKYFFENFCDWAAYCSRLLN